MDWSGTNPYAGVSTPQKGFPSILPLNEATDYVAAERDAGVFLGVDSAGERVGVDLDQEAPHILVSAATGGGKSAIARSIAVQRLRRGDMVVILDVKLHSHRWAKALAPNVHYASSIVDIGGALVSVGRELHRRNAVVDALPADQPVESADVGPRIIVVFEEMNATMVQLKALAKRLASEGSYQAPDALSDVSFMGRAVRIHLVSFAQLATYRASGGSEIVENYGTRILVRYSPKAWSYLASDCGKRLTAPEEHGRGVVCYGGKARETQLLWVPESEAGPAVTASIPAQKLARKLTGSVRNLPPVWRQAISGR